LEERAPTMLRDQVGTIMLGTVFLFIGLVACGISAIRGRRKDRILVWFGLLNVMWGARILAYAPAVFSVLPRSLRASRFFVHMDQVHIANHPHRPLSP
jgi:hypothetical protein